MVYETFGGWLRLVFNALSTSLVTTISSNETLRLSFRCSLLSNAVFWVASGFGLWADHLVATSTETKTKTQSSKLSGVLKSCKIQPNRVILGKDRADLVRLAFFNMVMMACFVCCPLFGFVWSKIQQTRHLEGPSVSEQEWRLIWKHEIGFKLPVHAILAEVAFYVFHGVLHWSPILYKHIHKVHHRFPAPTAMTCVYAHPIEFCFGNVLPIYLGPILCDSHPTTCYLWWALAMLGTCKGHSGYRILGHEDDHEDHHLLYKYNYGGMGVLDRLLGTTPPPTLPPTNNKRLSKTYQQQQRRR